MSDPVDVPGPITPAAAGQRKPVSKRHAAVGTIARALANADAGVVSALRRMEPRSPCPAFYRLTVHALDDQLPESGALRDRLETRWAVVVSAMASATGLLSAVAFGEALAGAHVAEARVVRLLEAHDEQLADLVRNVVHQMVQHAQPFNPYDLADLVLTDGEPRSQDARSRIARSFYRHEGT